MKNSFHFVFFLSFPMMFGISTVSDAFVPIFFGDGYEKVALLIKIISPILLLMGIANVIGTQYLLPTKRQKEYTISIVAGVVVNFILNYILIYKFASIGASIATVLSQIIVEAIQFYVIRNEISFKEVVKYSYKYLIVTFDKALWLIIVLLALTNLIDEDVLLQVSLRDAKHLIGIALLRSLLEETILCPHVPTKLVH